MFPSPSQPETTPVRTYPGVSFATRDLVTCFRTMRDAEIRERTMRGETTGIGLVIVAFGRLIDGMTGINRCTADDAIALVRDTLTDLASTAQNLGDVEGKNAVIAAMNNAQFALEMDAYNVQRGIASSLTATDDKIVGGSAA